MKNIIDIHGQNDNQTLLDKNSHIGYLDSFIGEEIYKSCKLKVASGKFLVCDAIIKRIQDTYCPEFFFLLTGGWRPVAGS